MRRLIIVAFLLLGLLAVASPALALQSAGGGDGMSLHFGRDARIDGPSAGVVVMVGADLELATDADTVVVVDGTASVEGAQIGTLVVIDGSARLGDGTRVTDVWLANGTLDRAEDVVITGTVRRGTDPGFAGRWLSRLIVALGFALVVLTAGLVAAATASRGFTRAAAALTDDPGPTMLAALSAWLGIPLVLIALAVTLVGLPLTVMVLLCVMPLLGAVGYAAVGLRVGQAVLRRPETEGRPLMPTFVGISTLVVIGQIPGIGVIVTLLSGFVGGGAVVLVAWRTIRGARPKPDTVPLLPA